MTFHISAIRDYPLGYLELLATHFLLDVDIFSYYLSAPSLSLSIPNSISLELLSLLS